MTAGGWAAPEAELVTAFLGLGSNLGDRVAYLSDGVRRLSAHPDMTVRAASAVYASRPWGGDRTQPEFLNMVLVVATTLAPLALLDACQAVEQAAGRQRLEHWGPRTLDIDLLLYGERRVETERLTLPHPRLHERGFVLIPLAELAAKQRLPGGGSVLEQLAALPPASLRDVWRWRGALPPAGTVD